MAMKCDFGEIKKKLKGVLSVSEIFELTVAGNIEKEDKRAMIGTTVNIVKESEDLIHELLTESEIDFSLTKETYPLYASPDFQGSSVYAVINYLLSLKDKKLSDNAGTLVAKDRDKIITATLGMKIYEYKQVKSQFDFYNEVTVYGSGLKSTKKDIKSIKQKGRKTLEVFLEELITQEDVDKSISIIKIHSQPQNNLILILPIDRVKTVYAGMR